MKLRAVQFKSNVGFKVGRGNGATMTAIAGASIGRQVVRSLHIDTDDQVLIMTADDPTVPPTVVPLSNVAFATSLDQKPAAKKGRPKKEVATDL